MKYKFLLAFALCLSLFTACDKKKTQPEISPIGQEEVPNNEIWYTTTDGKEIFPLVTDGFGANYISTTYREDKGIMLFDAAITDIPAGAFAYSDPLETMTLPKTVKNIGDYAFDQCRGLKDINLGEGIETIGKHAFCSCEKLTGGMSFPKTIKKICAEAFQNVYLPTISFHSDNVPTVEEGAFDEEAFFFIKVPNDKYDTYKANLGYYSKYLMTNHTVTKDDASSWMKYLPDAMPLHMVTMPGSHDAGTFDLHCILEDYIVEIGLLPMNKYAQVQAKNFTEQCNVGIRYFDLRPAIQADITYIPLGSIFTSIYSFEKNPNGPLKLYHGYENLVALDGPCSVFTAAPALVRIYECASSYESAVNTLINWVSGTDEFLIIDTQAEINGSSDPQRGYTRDRVVSLQNNWIANGYVVPYRPGLTVGDVRGKVILFDEDLFSAVEGAAILNDNETLGNKNGSAVFIKQNKYEFDHSDGDWAQHKMDYIRQHAQRYSEMNLANEVWSINQTTGYILDEVEFLDIFTDQKIPFPMSFCNGVQPLAVDYLQNELPEGPAGIITMDFAGVSDFSCDGDYKFYGDVLPSLIFLHNFK